MFHSKSFRVGMLALVLLTTIFSLLAVSPVPQAKGESNQTSSIAMCVLTPELLGGQGFSVTGLGFSVTGLGFSVTGLGFSVTGLGFSVTGLGISPEEIAQEIRDNPISNQWLANLQPDVNNGAQFNTMPVAILIVDDFSTPDSHGSLVLRVFQDLSRVVDMTRIRLVPIDVSGANVDYEVDGLEANIQQTIEGPNGLMSQGFNHFVINLSFGVIPCTHPGPVLSGVQYPNFVFADALAAINAANTPLPPQSVQPILECVQRRGWGHYTAYFGYNNLNDEVVNIPAGWSNFFAPGDYNREQPRVFEMGRHDYAFAVDFNFALAWAVRGPNGQYQFVTATAYSTPCSPQNLPGQTRQPVKPVLECVMDNGNGVFTARFGYENQNNASVTIEVGSENKFGGRSKDKGQTITFLPGEHKDVFRVQFNGNDISWQLRGPDHRRYTVTANKFADPCIDSVGFGLVDYVHVNLGVPEELVDEYVQSLVDSNGNEGDLFDLRVLLQHYQQLSASSDGAFAVIPVGASGNYRPWLFTQPLTPAAWPEVVAVGGTLGNYGSLWRFSQDGNVLAPAAGYPIGDNTYIAGTSFAAPFVSMVAAEWLTYPNACNFNGTLPPLTSAAQSKSANLTFVAGSVMPFDCSLTNSVTSGGTGGVPGSGAVTTTSYGIESNDASVTRKGRWSDTATPRASGGNYLSSNNKKATLTLEFNGTGINVNYLTGPSLGTFTIVVDDVAIRTVISWSSTTAFGNWSNITGLQAGHHTLQIVPTDGTVAIDSFYVTAQ
ncbi:MAG: S8/S53 family peptidase [Chloroflexi bacterium]|nr:S8/S53 family peptidase [Chloroflexota bacterium]